MRFGRLTFAVVSFLLGTSCTKGGPSFSVLDQTAIPQPMFNGQTSMSVTRASTLETTLIQGQCDPRIRSISVNLSGYASVAGALAVVSSGAPTVTCSTAGTFSFTLKSLIDLVGQPLPNQTYRLELRADTAGGISNPSLLLVTYTRDTWERWRLPAGGTESGTSGPRLSATGASFKADLRVINQAGDGDTSADAVHGTARSSSFVFKRGRASR